VNSTNHASYGRADFLEADKWHPVLAEEGERKADTGFEVKPEEF
jgi:hypothetical protein